ncbi:MAG: histidinol-phosphate transaminase [Gammaproteobacteria bacterium]|nr:MAG: histidinol-phosphate transaminase [Gammaproteobacteria bacterium]
MTTDFLALARPELRTLEAYRPAGYEPDCVRLNANEAPWRAPNDDSERGLNIYPPPRPWALTERLASHYGVTPDSLLVTRGSSEAIDLLVRGFCVPGQDEILICPPTFGMYQVYAAIQGAAVRRVALHRDQGFTLDTDGVVAALADTAVKLVFLCSPNNPTGSVLERAAIERVCEAVAGKGLVVLDEAYIDFVDGRGLLELRGRYPHLVILRTLSKAHGLAGARCGSLIAEPVVIDLLTRMLPPYGLPTPTLEAALASLEGDTVALMRERVEGLRQERARVAAGLSDHPQVTRVHPSEANFLLIETRAPAQLVAAARAHGILIRDFSADPDLPSGCLRISIGTPEQNDRLLVALATERRAHG